MSDQGRALTVLFLPAVINFLVPMAFGFYVYSVIRSPPERIGFEVMKLVMTYNFYWSVVQVAFGLYAAMAMGGLEWLRGQYSAEDLRGARDLALTAGLAAATIAVIWAFQFLNAALSGPEAYFKTWREVVTSLPLWSKLYFVAVAPFTAGIFEEILWRGYGISQLEKSMGTRRALVLQAVAFGVWHGLSLHTVATAIVGLLYGYVYARRRRLLLLSAAHTLADIIGFYFAFFAL